jgi:ABC-type dipeptide/oligopeptide/nickel transport system ATPase component
MTNQELAKFLGIEVPEILNTSSNALADVVTIRTATPRRKVERKLKDCYALGYNNYLVTANAKLKALVITLYKEPSKILRKESKLKKYTDYVVPVGESVEGTVTHDFKKCPHLIIAGATGSGKSMYLHSILAHIIKYNPESYILPVDFKGTEITMYEKFLLPAGVPNLGIPKFVEIALDDAVKLMNYRYQMFTDRSYKDIEEYNRNNQLTPMRRLFIVVDELADLMVQKGTVRDNIETALVLLAQKSRAAGIHLILSTQRPTVDVITGHIKANIVHRIALKVATALESRIILDTDGAETLQPREFLYNKGNGLVRGVAYHTDINKVRKTVEDADTAEITDPSWIERQGKARLEKCYEMATATLAPGGKVLHVVRGLLAGKKTTNAWEIAVGVNPEEPLEFATAIAASLTYMEAYGEIDADISIAEQTKHYSKAMLSSWLITTVPQAVKPEVPEVIDNAGRIKEYANNLSLKDRTNLIKSIL